jgi:DNA-binding GntR family transcriptional regulator
MTTAGISVDTAGGLSEPDGTSVQQAWSQIRQAIVRGELAPGQRLKVVDLQARFGHSAMPLREALRMLEGEGLVEVEPHRGATVRKVDRKFVQDLYEVRAHMEQFAVRAAIGKMTLAKKESLVEICNLGRKALESGDLGEFLDRDRALHRRIYEITDNREALRIQNSSWELVAALRVRFGYREGRVDTLLREHEMLVEALGNLDTTQAQKISYMHHIATMQEILEHLPN